MRKDFYFKIAVRKKENVSKNKEGCFLEEVFFDYDVEGKMFRDVFIGNF